MARKVVISVIDDLDGESPAVETVSFALEGVTYEIDLSEANAGELRAVFGKWTPFARKVGRARRTKREKSPNEVPAMVIREWARRNGHEVSQRGRIPASVAAAYRRATA
ncbi:histone-like nucleoid-structuring protein Lsr2 [Nocardia donostiensis]|uniref:Nucleoid-associated protein Lsr2 n=1 Tax=Nocardia donostiensis TaxID=1538463 RepID=A0A1W0ASC4_9NOCA|nr:Lsr2 family protein [Nocardia donostiensis]ONM47945.1 nucleoid-associated protein Lsr2 [Nocardia donostiensis]OQS13142.1 nucleoid-associated protein Lsr2 [Nocardia donostiensis]OQS21488.1 nucleoid-associated protein Lsr2 [Nocardia donostiensis]